MEDFIQSNWKILLISLVVVFYIQFLDKGNSIINISVITLHIIGDVFLIIAFKKFSEDDKKRGVYYYSVASVIFLIIGIIAVAQSDNGKNWQYLLGATPFWVANIFLFLDAWNYEQKKYFDYKLTALVAIFIAYLYYEMNLVYDHSWIQIFGYSLFPIFLSIEDSPRVYLARIFSVSIMVTGVFIDLKIQLVTQNIIPGSVISSFFITLIALFGFINNVENYKTKVTKDDSLAINGLKFVSFFRIK